MHLKRHAERIARDEDAATILTFEAKRAGQIKQQRQTKGLVPHKDVRGYLWVGSYLIPPFCVYHGV
jgi:hypothetical protein